MGAVTTLALKNAAATTVNFTPLVVAPESVTWAESAGTTLAAYRKALFSRKIPTAQSKSAIRFAGKLTYPVQDAVTGSIKHIGLGTWELVFPQDMITADRNELVARFRAFIADQIVTDATASLNLPY